MENWWNECPPATHRLDIIQIFVALTKSPGGEGGDWDAMYRHVTVLREWASNFSHDATRNPQEFRGTRPRYSNLQQWDRGGFRLRDETRRDDKMGKPCISTNIYSNSKSFRKRRKNVEIKSGNSIFE